jgi:hypothetical protein
MRFSVIAGLVILLVLVFGTARGGYLRAADVNGVMLQDTPGYDAPPGDGSGTDTGNGYNSPATDTPEGNPTQAVDTPTPLFTVTNTVTLPPDTFRTEDSEMNQSKTTPLVTETPGPTITVYFTPTVINTPGHPTPSPLAVKEKGAFTLDWGMFLFGFSLPVLGACGYTLYLLDRRPELFKRFRR